MSRYGKKIYLDLDLKELLELTFDEITYDLSEKEQAFCEHYVKSSNLKLSAIKAGYARPSAHCRAYEIRRRPRCKAYIAWLKGQGAREVDFDVAMLLDQYIRVAFADITDFVDVKDGIVKIRDSKELDGQLISEIKQGRDGVTIKMVDKFKAADKLERFFEILPKKWEGKIAEKKLELLEEKLKIERKKAGMDEQVESDGFKDAISGAVNLIWGTKEIPEDEDESEWEKVDIPDMYTEDDVPNQKPAVTEDEEEGSIDWDDL